MMHVFGYTRLTTVAKRFIQGVINVVAILLLT